MRILPARLAAVDAGTDAGTDAPPTLDATPEEVAEMVAGASGASNSNVPDKLKTIPKKAVERDLSKEVEPPNPKRWAPKPYTSHPRP